jgi:hypothetical protein
VAATFKKYRRSQNMQTAEAKLARIAQIAGAWLEPEGGLTSYRAMMEIIGTLEDGPRNRFYSRPEQEDAERRRWNDDRPHEFTPPHRTEALRVKSRFLG